MSGLRERLSYANVTATVALFVALGGTSYAVATLPRDSVGSRQIRQGAVKSSEVANRSLRLRDVSIAARRALRGKAGPTGPPGPAGVTLRAAVSSSGARVAGNATASTPIGPGDVVVEFGRDVSACQAVATLAAVPGGAVTEPPAGRVTVRPNGVNVEVRTFDVDGTPRDLPFNVVVAC
jgi:hypothetical protein